MIEDIEEINKDFEFADSEIECEWEE